MKSAFIVLMAVMVLSGCSGKVNKVTPSEIVTGPSVVKPPVEVLPEPAHRDEGSLFSDDVRMDLFTDNTARRVGDIITINIVESSSANKSAKTDGGRSTSIVANNKALLGWEDQKNIPLVGDGLDYLGLDTSKGIDVAYDSSFNGSSSTSRDEDMTARMSGRITQVLPNGNLVVRGSQEIMVNNETQYITVQGVARQADIAADNSILSIHLADARIDYTGKGDLSSKQREGWMARFVDVVWPF